MDLWGELTRESLFFFSFALSFHIIADRPRQDVIKLLPSLLSWIVTLWCSKAQDRKERKGIYREI